MKNLILPGEYHPAEPWPPLVLLEKHRKTEAVIRILDASGRPAPGVKVSLEHPAFFRLLTAAKQHQVPFDGIGIQAHEPRTMRFAAGPERVRITGARVCGTGWCAGDHAVRPHNASTSRFEQS